MTDAERAAMRAEVRRLAEAITHGGPRLVGRDPESQRAALVAAAHRAVYGTDERPLAKVLQFKPRSA
jgi:hypothetical protein